MTEMNGNINDLEQRLQNHYQQRYEQPPAPAVFWQHLIPHIDQQEEKRSTGNQRSLARLREKLSLPVDFFVTKQKATNQRIQEEHDLMKNDTAANNGLADNSHFAQGIPPQRHRLRRFTEAGMAALLVASILIGWFAVTRLHSTQGTPKPLFTYNSQAGENIYDLEWTPDGKYLTFVMWKQNSRSYRFLVWAPATGKVRQTLTVTFPATTPNGPQGQVIDSLDGRYALIVTYDKSKQLGTLRLANIITEHIDLIYQGYQYVTFPTTAFSHDSKYVAFVGSDRRIHIWDIAARKNTLIIDARGVPGLQMIYWSPTDDRRIITDAFPSPKSGKPETVQVWDAQTGHRLLSITETPSMSLFASFVEQPGGFSPDGQRILTANKQTGMLEERDSHTLKVLHTFPVQVLNVAGDVTMPVWLAGGTRIFLSKGQRAYIWDAATGRTVLTFSYKSATGVGPVISYTGGRYVASLQKGTAAEIWNTVTGAKVTTIDVDIHSLEDIQWLSDGTHIEIAKGNGQGQLYNAITGELLATYQGVEAFFSPDGKYLATEQYDVPDQKHGGVMKSIVQVLPFHP